MKIQFDVLGKPRGKQRPRMTKFGTVYTPKETRQYEKMIQESFKKIKPLGWTPINEAVSITVEAYFVKAKSNKDLHCTIKPDIDNILKVVLDSIQGNGQVIADDKTVVEVITRKFWGQVDKISIEVEAVK
jgi:Holliday junction resolvase RusA-like endonuclease